MTATTRAGLGLEQASSSRYTYVVIALLLPLSAIALSRVAMSGAAGAGAVVVMILLVGSYNVGVLAEQANAQAASEQWSRRLASATLAQWLADPSDSAREIVPDPYHIPFLTIGGIAELNEHGWFDPGDYGPMESLTAEEHLRVNVERQAVAVTACATAAGDTVVLSGEPLVIADPLTGIAVLTLTADGVTATPRRIRLGGAPTVISYDGTHELRVRGETEPLTLCRVATPT
jgi:hypothetical protein